MSERRLRLIGFALVVLVAVGVRFALAWGYYGNFDQESYEIVQGILRQGGNVYAETSRYNYSPVWFFTLGFLDSTAGVFGWPDHATIRMFLTVMDLATGLVLLRIAGPAATVAFLLNPVSILVTGFHGQFDGIAVLFLLLAAGGSRGSAPFAVVAVLVKQIVLPMTLFVRPAWPYRQKLVLTAISLLALILSVIPFAADGRVGIVRNVFMYSGLAGEYGVTSLNPALALPFAALMLRVLLVLAFLALATRTTLEPLRAVLLAMLLFLVLTPGFGTQYFALPVAFGAALRTPWYWLYTAVAAWHILGSPVNVGLVPATHPNIVWVAAIIWLGAELFRRGAQPTATHLRLHTAGETR